MSRYLLHALYNIPLLVYMYIVLQYLHQLPTLPSIWSQTGKNFGQIDPSSQFKCWFKSF